MYNPKVTGQTRHPHPHPHPHPSPFLPLPALPSKAPSHPSPSHPKPTPPHINTNLIPPTTPPTPSHAYPAAAAGPRGKIYRRHPNGREAENRASDADKHSRRRRSPPPPPPPLMEESIGHSTSCSARRFRGRGVQRATGSFGWKGGGVVAREGERRVHVHAHVRALLWEGGIVLRCVAVASRFHLILSHFISSPSEICSRGLGGLDQDFWIRWASSNAGGHSWSHPVGLLARFPPRGSSGSVVFPALGCVSGSHVV
jgi:hypothetical protein